MRLRMNQEARRFAHTKMNGGDEGRLRSHLIWLHVVVVVYRSALPSPSRAARIAPPCPANHLLGLLTPWMRTWMSCTVS